jgi:hypothetical protein
VADPGDDALVQANARIADLERQVRELKATERAVKGVLANKDLRPGEKVTAIVLAFETAAHQNKREHPDQPHREGFYKVSLPALAERTGASVQSVGGHIETLHRAGVFEKSRRRTYDPATEQWRTELYLRPPAERPAARAAPSSARVAATTGRRLTSGDRGSARTPARR